MHSHAENPNNNPRLRTVIETDVSAGSGSPDAPESDKAPEKKSRKPLVIALSSIAGVALAAGIGMGLSANQAPQSAPTTETSADPTDTAEPTPEQTATPELTVEDIEIQAGLSAEQVGQAIIQRFDDWRNEGGSDKALYDEWIDTDLSNGEFTLAKAEGYAAIYAEALYVEGWQSHEDLKGNYEFNVRVNAETLEINLKTSNLTSNPALINPDDLEPYQRNIIFDGAREISSGDGTRVIEIDYYESNNADKNRAGEAFSQQTADFGQPTGRFTMTLVTVDGVERIAQTEVGSR